MGRTGEWLILINSQTICYVFWLPRLIEIQQIRACW